MTSSFESSNSNISNVNVGDCHVYFMVIEAEEFISDFHSIFSFQREGITPKKL